MIRKTPLPTAGQALQPQEPRITLSQQLSASLRHLKPRITLLPEPYACCVLFFTVAVDGAQAGVFFVRRTTLEAAWREGSTRVRQWAWMRQLTAVELRIDWPDEIIVIGNRIPALHPWAAASAWALADDDLEHAELIPPAALASARHAAAGTPRMPGAATPPLPGLAEVNLLLRLQGLHVDRNGLQTELPAAPSPQRPPPDPGLHGTACQARCVAHALQLARQQAADPAPAHAAMVEAMERALVCLEQNLAHRHAPADPMHMEQAMCLLAFTRCIADRNPDGAFTCLISHMERLTTRLAARSNAAPPGAGP